MKHILIISASPRKNGNSEILCDRFANGALESGCKVEKVFLASKNIGYCRGCGVCNSTRQCVQRDDMEEILDKMNGKRGCDRPGNACLFLFYGRADENFHRQDCAQVYRNKE